MKIVWILIAVVFIIGGIWGLKSIELNRRRTRKTVFQCYLKPTGIAFVVTYAVSLVRFVIYGLLGEPLPAFTTSVFIFVWLAAATVALVVINTQK